MQNKVIILLLLTFISGLISCSLEQKVAIKIQKELPKTTILLTADPELYKANNKFYIPENISDEEFGNLFAQSMDSSDFIGQIDVDAYWEQTKREIENYLINSGLKYLPSDSITDFIAKDKPKFIFDIKQVEIDEFSVDYVETFTSSFDDFGYFDEYYLEYMKATDFEARIDNYTVEVITHFNEENLDNNNIPGYNKGISITKKQSEVQIIKPINAVSINYWIEVNSYLKNEGHKRELIYISRSMEDEVTYDNEIKYEDILYIQSWFRFTNLGYRIDSLDVDKIWLKSNDWSKEMTDILNSYILDRVIEDGIHKDSDTKYRKRHWELNTKTGRVLPTDKPADYTIIEQYEND